MEKILMFSFSSNCSTYCNVIMTAQDAAYIMQEDMTGVAEEEIKDQQYIIKPVWMTQQEIDDLPEADI